MALLTPDWVMPRSVAARTKLCLSATFTKIAKVRRSGIGSHISLIVIDEITTGLIIRLRPKHKFQRLRHGGANKKGEGHELTFSHFRTRGALPQFWPPRTHQRRSRMILGALFVALVIV